MPAGANRKRLSGVLLTDRTAQGGGRTDSDAIEEQRTGRAGEVSVVGDFNDWQPGAHLMAERLDGSRAGTVAFPMNQHHGFRYLADGGHWLDEEGADGHDGRNCLLHT